jgi:hypothetical protein
MGATSGFPPQKLANPSGDASPTTATGMLALSSSMHGDVKMNTEPQSTIAWIRNATDGTALVGDRPISHRVAPMADKARTIRRLAKEVMKDGTGLLRDLVQERPILVFGVVATTALLLGRFASARTLATVASIGVEAGKLGNLAAPG